MASRKKSASGGGEPNGGTAEAATVDAPAPPKRRGPGRPKGSKNRTTKAAAATAKRRGPGRPPGSKNRAKRAGATKAAAARAGRGRGAVSDDITRRIDGMIADLNALKAEVAKFEKVRSALKDLV